ncbi:MAG TPA: divergent polysaccharide deacetylase family protein [Rhodospirillaceae bacterium]|nr:divergent polysaccharide deacetylase family protein [Rhodospirillaceae bacterium]
MNEPAPSTPEQVDVTIAFQAALMARRESFLAKLPRVVKLVGAGSLLLVIVFSLVQFIAMPDFGTSGGQKGSYEKEDDADLDLESIPTTLDPMAAQERRLPQTRDEAQAAEANDTNEAALDVAPDMGIVEATPSGYLPRIGDDGRRPWQVYAKRFDYRDPRPRIALVISDLGYSRVATDAALHRTPSAVTLAFDVQGTSIDEWLTRARQEGHETLLSIPMEPFDYPRSDPGPNALLSTLPNADNIVRLRSALGAGQGYVSITTLSGSRFITDESKVEPVLEELRKRGLLLLDAKVSAHSVWGPLATKMKVPVAENLRFIDSTPTPQAIDAALAQLEQTARVEGVAIGMASPLPVSIERIEIWARQLKERGIVLTPISSIVR